MEITRSPEKILKAEIHCNFPASGTSVTLWEDLILRAVRYPPGGGADTGSRHLPGSPALFEAKRKSGGIPGIGASEREVPAVFQNVRAIRSLRSAGIPFIYSIWEGFLRHTEGAYVYLYVIAVYAKVGTNAASKRPAIIPMLSTHPWNPAMFCLPVPSREVRRCRPAYPEQFPSDFPRGKKPC